MKIAICTDSPSVGFLPPVELILAEGGHETRRFEMPNQHVAAIAWADAIWVEWCRQAAVDLSRSRFLGRRPLVVRMHRYEADGPWPAQVDWDQARLVVTSRHILARAALRAPAIHDAVVIPSIVDFDAFPLQQREEQDDLRIAVVGYWSGRKQTGLALEAARSLSEEWNIRMSLIGEPHADEPWWKDYLRSQPTTDFACFTEPWTQDVAGIWARHDACLSTSADEGCPYNVIEAMACGVPAFVHAYPGAEAQFPEQFVWDDLGDLSDMVSRQFSDEGWKPDHIRAWAQMRYSIEANRDAVLALFKQETQCTDWRSWLRSGTATTSRA